MAKAYRIETERLVIRCYHPADAPLLKKSIDESLEHLMPWMPWTKHEPETVEQKTERLQHFKQQFDTGEDYPFGIFNKTETEVVGSTGLHTRAGEGAREIGYWINVHHVGKGYIKETVSALVKTGFDIEGLDRIEIRCDPKNESSSKIPARLGFTHQSTLTANAEDINGNLRDTMVWILFKDQYLQTALKNFPLNAFDAGGKKIF